MKKILMLLLTISLVLSLVSFVGIGCKAEEGKAEEEAAAEEEEAEEEVVEEEVSKSGGELVVRIAGDIENFDTHTDQLQIFRSVFMWTIFEPLVRYDENLELQPAIAESWEVQGNSWIFNIRKGIKFHDGSDLTAEDVKYSLDRVKDPETASWLIGNLANMTKATVIDDYTLEVELDKTVASFLDQVSVIGIMPKGSGEDQSRNPIGSGPFKFVEYKADQHVIVEKFEDYWVEGKPLLDKITFRPVPEVSIALTELESGDLDIITQISPSEAASVESISNATLLVQDATTMLAFFEVNRHKDPLYKPEVYQALAKCLDREAVGELVYKGYGTPTNVPVSPLSAFYKEIPSEYDPEAAKAELEALGYKEGDISLKINTWSGLKNLEDMAVIWKEGLNKAGVDITIEVGETQVMLDIYNSHSYDIITNIYAPPPDPDAFYDMIWGHRLADDYNNPDGADLIEQGRSTFDVNERKEVYDQLQQTSVENGPCVHVWYEAALAGCDKAVKDLIITPVNDYDFSNVWIEN